MAVLQISQMQVRQGKKSDLPEALAEGEFGYATDTGELFIGAPSFGSIQWRRTNGSVQGVFPFSNIKILTEQDMSYTITGQLFTQGPLLTAVLNGTENFDTQALSIPAPTQNCFIFDYSIIATGNNTDSLPRRIGTLWIISNSTDCEILDNYTELTVVNPQGSGISIGASIVYAGSNNPENRYLSIVYQNNSGNEYNLYLSGKSWQSSFRQSCRCF